MIGFLRSLLPDQIPDRLRFADELSIIREKILQIILLSYSTLGIIIYAVNLISGLRHGGNWITIALTTIMTALIFVTTIRRDLPVKIRVAPILVWLFFVGVEGLLVSGFAGNYSLFFVAFILMTGITLGAIPALWAIVLCVISLFAVGWGMISGKIASPSFEQVKSVLSAGNWFLSGSLFLCLSLVLISSLYFLLTSLQHTSLKLKSVINEIDNDRANLEDRIAERTKEAERRSLQIRTTAEISQAISSILDRQMLIQQVVNLIQENFKLYYVGLFLVDDQGQYAVLRAGTGEAGQKMLTQGHRLQIGGTSMIGWSIANRKPRIALDVDLEEIRFNNPFLPATRSEMAIPILSRTSLLGALTIQSDLPNAFDENDIVIMRTIADSLAIALENARLFEQNQKDLDEIRALNRQFIQQTWKDVITSSGTISAEFANPTQSGSKDLHLIDIPIILRDQEIAHISLEIAEESITPQKMEMVEAIASQTALALESARLLEDTQRRMAQEEKINQLSARFSRGLNIESILKSALLELGQVPLVEEVSIKLQSSGQIDRARNNPSPNLSDPKDSYGHTANLEYNQRSSTAGLIRGNSQNKEGPQ